ncbi:M48 family metallopeptidase [Marinomonas mediterranea]|uniref:Peptidase M48 Ste24p n=1 Tax=Marinomonas mediterranea (strain ATCC 700492 / JCM 21426 / NBRC 103028 / MMB-1) TaxID=717774 RepID=F2K2U4_MARM1|nr:M48 family metalloprotease [Marinomonas mediterranea]ADZ91227.1 peptidase M48 Ste24p [Marinomonas mediterranea MMB-1]WCN17353.1 M48 family metalloprotease [Marinomonas mediterranea MMB-1]
MQRLKNTVNILLALISLTTVLSSSSWATTNIPDLEAIKDERSLSNPSYVLGQYWFRQYNGSNALIDFPPAYEFLRNAVSKLASYSDLYNKNVELALLNSSQSNAFVIPGNHLFIYSDILSLIKEEDELFALLAHELSHLELRHYERRLQNAEQEKKKLLMLLAAGVAAAIMTDDSETTSALWIGGIANQTTNQLAYSRENEQEADRNGRQLLNQAGISSDAMTKLFNEFLKKTLGGNSLEFLSTHPLPKTRLSDSITGKTLPKTKTSLEASTLHTSSNFGFFRATLIGYRALLDDRPNYYINSQQLSTDEALFATAIVNYQSETPEKAIQTLKKMTSINRFSDYLLALSYIKNNAISEATSILNKRLDLAPGDAIFKPLLAQIEGNHYLPYSIDELQYELRLKLKTNIQIAIKRGDNASALLYKAFLEFNKGKNNIGQVLLDRAKKQGADNAKAMKLADFFQRIIEAEQLLDIGP